MKQKKRIFICLFCAVMIFMVSLTACSRSGSSSDSSTSSSGSSAAIGSSSSAAESASEEQPTSAGTSKILVAYFSQTGHTRTLANQIHDQAGGDLFEIVPEKAYTSDYNALTSQAQQEKNENYKPTLKTKVENMASYNVIFVGSPIWWGTISSPVRTFLSEYDFSGKTIIPFDTNGGSGLGTIVEDIKKLCPKATVQENGLAVRDSDVDNAKNTVAEWLKKIEINK